MKPVRVNSRLFPGFNLVCLLNDLLRSYRAARFLSINSGFLKGSDLPRSGLRTQPGDLTSGITHSATALFPYAFRLRRPVAMVRLPETAPSDKHAYPTPIRPYADTPIRVFPGLRRSALCTLGRAMLNLLLAQFFPFNRQRIFCRICRCNGRGRRAGAVACIVCHSAGSIAAPVIRH